MDYILSTHHRNWQQWYTEIPIEQYYVLKFGQFLRGFPAWLALGSFMQVQTLSLVLSEPGGDWSQGCWCSSERPRHSNWNGESKTVQWSRHTVNSTFFWWEMDMGYQILIQNCLLRSSDNVTKSGSYWFTHLVITTSCNFGATVMLVFHKGDWSTVNFYSLPTDIQTQLIRGRAGSWIRSVWLQELITETPVCLNTNRVSHMVQIFDSPDCNFLVKPFPQTRLMFLSWYVNPPSWKPFCLFQMTRCCGSLSVDFVVLLSKGSLTCFRSTFLMVRYASLFVFQCFIYCMGFSPSFYIYIVVLCLNVHTTPLGICAGLSSVTLSVFS